MPHYGTLGVKIVNLSNNIGNDAAKGIQPHNDDIEQLRSLINQYKADYKNGYWMKGLTKCGANMQIVCQVEFED